MIRLAVFGFLALGVTFVLVSIYGRSVERERLEKKWDAEVKTGDRDAYIDEGLREYEGSLRRRLIWLVFIVPLLAIAGLTYVMNFM